MSLLIRRDCEHTSCLLLEEPLKVLATIYSDRPGRHVLMGKCV